ncbi:MAG: class I SAM-dependent methyltransferase, partial [Acidobacteriota bacterium]
ARLTGLLVEQMQPRSVLDIGCGVGHWLDAFRAHGVADVAGVEDPAFLAATDAALRPGAEPRDLAQFSPVRRVDLCLCLGVVHRVPQATAEAVVAACTRASDTVVFSAPAPGIGLPGYINERPWVVWHRLFLSHGFTLCDELRPLVEERWGRYPSPYDLLVVYRRAATTPVAAPSDPVGAALLAAWQRIDEQVLQGFWFARALAAVPPVVAKPLPRLRYVRFEIAPERMDAGPQPGTRTFRFRALATSVALAADGVDAPMVAEDAAPLSLADGGDWSRPGQFSVDAQAIVFSSRDGSDPRHNGRTYTVRLPAHVAWLEHQPGATVLEREL